MQTLKFILMPFVASGYQYLMQSSVSLKKILGFVLLLIPGLQREHSHISVCELVQFFTSVPMLAGLFSFFISTISVIFLPTSCFYAQPFFFFFFGKL